MDRVAHRGPLARAPGALKGDTSEIVNIFVIVEGVLSQNIKKLKDGKIFIFGKKSHSAEKKTERGDPLGFSNIHSVAKHQKMQGDPLGIFFSKKKSRSAEKK